MQTPQEHDATSVRVVDCVPGARNMSRKAPYSQKAHASVEYFKIGKQE